ncbi:MAG: glycosyltransferase family 1 protein [Bacteroidetes bacterium]|nr:MAG: glycosyltransferase family 1 protein [Bacteroidota bacterium]RLD68590.1 MAG: glycosyltransferase family 1 protein [Bacteroidota bacterium]
MKIGILGTRGIPNRYGGFEQWAEQLSQGLVQRGCEVTVYNSHFHPYRKKDFYGVEIIRKWDPKTIGLASQFIYDLLCILSARKKNFDTIIQLGYTTSSVWAWLLPKKAKVLYNMDGIEWKREKYKGIVKSFLKYAEQLAVNNSDVIIADAKPIKRYFEKKYDTNVEYIAYPAKIFDSPESAVLKKHKLSRNNYSLLIARFQPDNNLEMIIKGTVASKSTLPLLIVGDYDNKYGRHLLKKYKDKRIVFLGKIFDKKELDNLRYFSSIYFHGHSAGGTNPSLLEAMATSCIICAHNNEFNKSVLDNDAWYFTHEDDISALLNSENDRGDKANWIENNLDKLRNNYNLDVIINDYQKLF